MDSLQHHGILGQKWGIRRYQNKDGTLTRAGKKRLQQIDGEKKKKEPSPSEKVKTMTNDELNDAINRLRLEQQYLNYFAPKKEEPKKPGFVKTTLTNAAKSAVTQVANSAANELANELTNKLKNKNKKETLAKDYRLEDADRMTLSQLKTANDALSQLKTYKSYFENKPAESVIKKYHISDVSKMTLSQLQEANTALKAINKYKNYLSGKVDKDDEND